jgi:short subunit dehydrogenase-like uncharacterized protein
VAHDDFTMSPRDYDLVLYGASGFTGRQAAEHLARHARGLRWALAGRDHGKLEAARDETGAKAEILVAEAADRRALGELAARARVVISTAGPFALYGSALVDACVAHRTHYADIAGETPWVRDLIDRHHARAAAEGTRLVPCCGFDSVPSDLGAWRVVQELRERHGAGCVEVKAYFRMRGGFNGGTIASALNLQDSGQAARLRDPFLLSPGRHSRQEIERNRDPEWIAYDEAVGAWVGPFFMGPINTRVVRRSAALCETWSEPYGPVFRYQEYLRYDHGLTGRVVASVATGAAGLFQLALASPARDLIRPLLPQPGSGPSQRARDQGWFECVLIGEGEDGSRARARIAFKGDPGNRATVTFLCESGLALAEDGDRLPGGATRGGVLTPATALGGVLVERLKRAGTTIESATP